MPRYGIEVLDRLHQADVALLDEVEQVARGARVLVRDLDHQAQVGGDQPQRVLRVARFLVALGDFNFLLAAEQGKAADFG